MRINDPLYKEIRVRLSILPILHISLSTHTQSQGFLRILIKKSNLNRTIPFKHQRCDEVHKIFTAVCPLSPSLHLCIAYLILCSQAGKKYPVLNKFECNWVTAAMIQGCLKNFRGRTRRLALMADKKPNHSGIGRRDMGADAGSLSRSDTDPGAGGGSDSSGDAAISRPPSRLTFDSDSSGFMSDRWDIDID